MTDLEAIEMSYDAQRRASHVLATTCERCGKAIKGQRIASVPPMLNVIAFGETTTFYHPRCFRAAFPGERIDV